MIHNKIPDISDPLGEPEIQSPSSEPEIMSPPVTDVPNPEEPSQPDEKRPEK